MIWRLLDLLDSAYLRVAGWLTFLCGSETRAYRREVKRWHGLLDTLDPKTGEIRE